VFSAGALGGLFERPAVLAFSEWSDYGPCRDTCANQMGPAAYLLGRHLGRHLGSDVPAAMAEGFRCAEGLLFSIAPTLVAWLIVFPLRGMGPLGLT